MEVSKFNRRRHNAHQAGFSMIETMFATVILSVCLLSLAGLMSKLDFTTSDSRYVGTAQLLTSEKLEELTSLATDDPQIAIGAGNSVGDLDKDDSANVGGNDVAYFDEVMVAAMNGKISETRKDSDTGQYVTISQTPDGSIEAPEKSDELPNVESGSVLFKRRWVIEKNLPGIAPTQVRRITVRVEYPTGIGKTASFQMSTVRDGK